MPESESHKHLKRKVASDYEERGFDVVIEKRLPNSQVVDVYAESEDKKLAIEVGAMNGFDREEKLKNHVDEVIQLRQLDKPQARSKTGNLKEVRADITEAMNTHIDTKLSSGLYGSKAEYIRDVIRDDMERGGE